jgi:hypothetical protein
MTERASDPENQAQLGTVAELREMGRLMLVVTTFGLAAQGSGRV